MTTPGESRISAPSLSDDTVQAMLLTYERYTQATGRAGRVDKISTTKLERFDRVLDELARHPARTGDPNKIVSNAWGNAGKVVRDHQRVMVRSYGHLEDDEGGEEIRLTDEVRQSVARQAPSDQVEQLEMEVRDVLANASFSSRDLQIAELLMGGLGAEEVAAELNVAVPVAQVAVSRFRKRARRFWLAA